MELKGKLKIKQTLNGKLNNKEVYPELEDLDIIPLKTKQYFTHPNSYGYNVVTVEPYEVNLETKTINPTTDTQIIIPDVNYEGLEKVIIEPVTSSIDSNIISENIKNGVTILGVQGISSVVNTSDADATANDIKTGKTAYVNGSKITGQFNGIVPSGTLSITSNGTYDITNYASVTVNVVPVLDYITATFNSGNNKIYITDTLNSLKQYLTVVAYYDNGFSETISSDDYTLSGTLLNTNNYLETFSTITVTYRGKTDTFIVNKYFKIVRNGSYQNTGNTEFGVNGTSVRAVINPFGFALETGKTYTFSVGSGYMLSYTILTFGNSAYTLDNIVESDTQKIIYSGEQYQADLISWTDNTVTYTADGTYNYMVIVFKKSNNGTITDTDISAIQNSFTYTIS